MPSRTIATLTATALGLGVGAAALIMPIPATAASSRCHGAALSITAANRPDSGRYRAYVLRFENVSHHTCTLRGYPGVKAFGRHGRLKAYVIRTRSGPSGGAPHGPTTVTLHRHHYASAIVEWDDLGPRGANHLRVKAPNTTHTVTIHRSVLLYSLQVHPVVGGRSGNA